jgi:hypothetical protein
MKYLSLNRKDLISIEIYDHPSDTACIRVVLLAD